MYAFDTDVASQFLRPEPAKAVVSWTLRHDPNSIYLTAVSEAEMRFGVADMKPGKRKNALQASLERWLEKGFGDRVAPFDSGAAKAYAQIATKCRRLGRPIDEADCQIAAICQSQRLILVTGNDRHFKDTGIIVVNPWTTELH